jgi:cytochrome b involved in lipid metabolism/ferredoxin-NADP reductase
MAKSFSGALNHVSSNTSLNSRTLIAIQFFLDAMKSNRRVLVPGQLAPVPRFQELPYLIGPGPARDCYVSVHRTMLDLGRAVQLGQHRLLIDSLACMLSQNTLFAITAEALHNLEVCSAFSVYLTTLEQIYHWPRDKPGISTPEVLHDHKLVIQVLHEPELRKMLEKEMDVSLDCHSPHTGMEVAQAALAMAGRMLGEARKDGISLPPEKQDHVNLLYRTCRQDWFVQGGYDDASSHLEFGRLHEVIRTNGTQRRVQEIFEETGGLFWLQRMPNLLNALPMSTHDICMALVDLQVTVMRTNDELFSMMIDETLWGRTFARFSKAVGLSKCSAGGADCAMFRMLDALCGRADAKSQAMLLDELDFRSRFFPPNMRALIDAVASSPSVRSYASSVLTKSYAISQAFNALQRALWALYEMHRKKALRIILALRAGQAQTSSGTQKAVRPEQHIGGILGEAMRVRFGSDPDALQVDAYGWSSPLLYGKDGRVEAAHIRFAISTPLAVSSGDAIRVNVQTQKGQWKTRTYSVMRAAPHWRNSVADSAGAVTSIEVCVRRQGAVSSYLCNQSSGFEARVAAAPAPHFRIQKNANVADETVFVAQGAAAGLFIAWLENHQHHLEGRYTLIVGARSVSQLAQADQLSSLAASYRKHVGACVEIIVCLSAPATTDVETLRAAGIQTHRGRVTKHLWMDAADRRGCAVYVCGSAAFGVDVARCLANDRQPEHTELGTRLDPVCTSRLPRLRLLVAAGTVSENGNNVSNLRTITVAELAQHNFPNDMWMAVKDRVYDVTPVVSFHPGGEKLLTYWAGRQAEDIFNLIHGGSYNVTAMLHELEIGKLAPAAVDENLAIWERRLDRILEMQNDLTNNSRFEQTPTGCPIQLSSAPPVDAIRGSLDIFFTTWTGFISDHGLSVQADTSSLVEALGNVWTFLDEYQANVYLEAFHEVRQCALALRAIFQALLATISRIHEVIDDVKRQLLHILDDHFVTSPQALQGATRQFILLLTDIAPILKEGSLGAH